MKLKIILFAILLNIIKISFTNDCVWRDPRGYMYDLKSLHKQSYWKVKDEDNGFGMFFMVYLFNFCD